FSSRAGARAWAPRLVVIAATGALAVVRLSGASPLSGHAVLLVALGAYESALPSARSRITIGFAPPRLFVTPFYKRSVWHDAAWFAVSAAVGLAIGGVCALFARPNP